MVSPSRLRVLDVHEDFFTLFGVRVGSQPKEGNFRQVSWPNRVSGHGPEPDYCCLRTNPHKCV